MSLGTRWHYYRRIFDAYLGSGSSQLTFWHETPEANPRASRERLAEYYMLFRQKADYAGHHDAAGIPMLDYRGRIGLQYNPIAIAQWGLANYNLLTASEFEQRWKKTLAAAEWLRSNLQQNRHGLWVWNHQFDWEYRKTLKAPWYSGLAQGQGVSLLLRAHAHSGDARFLDAAQRAFVPLATMIGDGGVLFEDSFRNIWIEEYLVDPPTHILNGFIWALWGVFDYWLVTQDAAVRQLFNRAATTVLVNLGHYDTGYWSLYEQPGTRLKMLSSPFYHRLHIIQLRTMAFLTGSLLFTKVADRWERYTLSRANRLRALAGKAMFKLLYY